MKPRLGTVPYLNAEPLISWFRTPEGGSQADLFADVPAQLAPKVLRGELDCAIASSFFVIGSSSLRIAPNVSISSFGPVESVRLFSKVPFEKIETLALDASSATSTHLAQIILAERFGSKPRTFSAPPDFDEMLSGADACVLIGDVGMRQQFDGPHVLDLGEAWTRMTNLPFVWALWIGRNDLDSSVVPTLLRAKSFGIAHIEEAAEFGAARSGFDYHVALRYLAEVIEYDLTEKHFEGLSLFARLCERHGFAPSARLPQVVGEPSAI